MPVHTGSPTTLGSILAAHLSPAYVYLRGEKGKGGLLSRTGADDRAYNASSAGKKGRIAFCSTSFHACSSASKCPVDKSCVVVMLDSYKN